MKTRSRYFLAVSIMGLILFGLFLRSLPDGKTVLVAFCDVGQGDSVYLRFPNGEDMLIDGGPDGSVLTCLGKYKPFWNRSVGSLLLTHADLDHFGGFIQVLQRYSVQSVIVTGVENSSTEYQLFWSLVQKEHARILYASAGDRLRISGVEFYWLWPTLSVLESRQRYVEQYLEDNPLVLSRNDMSQVVYMRYGDTDILFTGDAGSLVEKEYMHSIPSNGYVDVLKIPHHGSKSAITSEYLSYIKPKFAVISNAAKNRYGHPSEDVIHLLQAFRVQIERTDQGSDVVFTTDGKHLIVQK